MEVKAHSLKALYPKPAKTFSGNSKNLQNCKENVRGEVHFK